MDNNAYVGISLVLKDKDKNDVIKLFLKSVNDYCKKPLEALSECKNKDDKNKYIKLHEARNEFKSLLLKNLNFDLTKDGVLVHNFNVYEILKKNKDSQDVSVEKCAEIYKEIIDIFLIFKMNFLIVEIENNKSVKDVTDFLIKNCHVVLNNGIKDKELIINKKNIRYKN